MAGARRDTPSVGPYDAGMGGRFPMSLDGLNQGITWFVVVVVAVVVVSVIGSPAGPIALPIVGLVAVGLAVAWALAPTALEIDGHAVRICRRAWRPLDLPLVTIASVETTPPMGLGFRLFGVGGFFGSYGLFWARNLGRFMAYVTRRGPSVLLRRRGALPVMVTPDDPEGFVRTLRLACGL